MLKEVKIKFADLLLKVQRAPVQINKNGMSVAVVVEEYQDIERLKLHLLQEKIRRAWCELKVVDTADGQVFF